MIASFILATALTIGAPDKPVLEYRHDDVPFKPYVAQLYTPSGVPVLRDSPSDHKHHHALMFAVAADGVDFWSENPKCGKQVSRETKSKNNRIVEKLDWTAPDGKLILNEERTLTVHPGPVTLLTWQSRLKPKDAVKLTGSHYFGLGARFVTSMDKVGTVLYPAKTPGVVVRGTEKLTPSRWCAYTAPVNGKVVTFAIFDHPSNPRHPAPMFTMTAPFAYLSATLNLSKEPYILKKPLDLTYGVALWDGKQSVDEIERVYQQWIK